VLGRTPRLIVSISPDSVAAAVLRARWGKPQIRALARIALAKGVVVVSSCEPNIVDEGGVGQALAALRRELRCDGRAAVLVLPAGIARPLLVSDGATAGGRFASELARFRLAATLPFAANEAVVDGLALGGGRHLAAAVRRSVLEGYERAFAAAGFEQRRVDLAPLAATAALKRRPARADSGLDVILGQAAVSLAAWRNGDLVTFRTRLRASDADDSAALWSEVERTAALALGGAPALVRVVGPGALEWIRFVRARGQAAEPGWDLPGAAAAAEPCELEWLGAALA
jgi:hypothetical protein